MDEHTCKCGNPSDGWPDDACQECWEEYCDKEWWEEVAAGER